MIASRDEWTRQLAALLGTPPTEGNSLDVLRNGVEVFPAKLATIGSTNFNQRSTRLDEENNVVIFDRHVVSVLDDHIEHDLGSSTVVDPTEWSVRGAVQRVGERVMGAVSGWL